MEIRIIREIDGLMACAEDWNEILRLQNNQNYFLTLHWIKSWWEFFHEDHSLYILEISEHGVVIGFVPMMTQRKILCTEYRFVTYPRGIRAGMVIRPGYEQTVVSNAIRHLRAMKAAVFYLNGFEKEGLSYNAMLDSLKDTRHFVTTQLFSSISITGDCADSYYKNVRKHNDIKKTYSSEKKLSTILPLWFGDAAPAEVEQIFPLHEKRWSKKNDNNGFGRGIPKEFYTFLEGEGNPRSPASPVSFETNVCLLKAGKKLIGFTYGFICNGHFSFCRLAHDDDFRDFRPGLIVTKDIIEKSFAAGMTSFDFSTGDERYKQSWANQTSYLCQIGFGSKSILSQAALFFSEIRNSAKEFLKKSRFLLNFKRVTMGRIKNLFSGAPLKNFVHKEKMLFKQSCFPDIFKGLYFVLSGKANKIDAYQLYQVPEYQVKTADRENIAIFCAKLDDLDCLSAMMVLPREQIAKRYKNGDCCNIFIKNGDQAGFAWVSSTQVGRRNKPLWECRSSCDRCLYDICFFRSLDPSDEQEILRLLSEEIYSSTDKMRGKIYALFSRITRQAIRVADQTYRRIPEPLQEGAVK